MYLGHVGIALGAKGIRPGVALLVLLLATYAPDWVDSGLCIVGAYDPRGMLSHSFPVVLVLGVGTLAVYYAYSRDMAAALVVAGVVLSHAMLDWITGYKPTWPGGPMIGLKLYSQPVANLLIEGVVILIGVAIYRRTLPRRSGGWMDVGMMLGALVLMQIGVTVVRALTISLPKC